jgi:hypothetical protein
MSKLLDFKTFIGGSDNVIAMDMFPKEQQTFTYQFGAVDVSNYVWDIDYQTLVIDAISFNRLTGEPNYTDSNVIGFFDVQQSVVNTFVDTSDAANGNVAITIQADRYTGQLLPNSRVKVPTTCFSVKWTDGNTPAITNIHRYVITERYTAEVTIGDPTLETSAQGGYTAI